jgi:DeoR family glucitol operon repressor
MSIETRREMLVRYLREHGRTSVNDLAAHFNITGATVRSDLRHLEQAQLVVRRYGGAEAFTQPALEDHSMDEKTVLNLNTKQRHHQHQHLSALHRPAAGQSSCQ